MEVNSNNRIKGRVVEIKEGAVNASVVIDIGGGNIITASITMDSVKELNIRTGHIVVATIKATSVMVGANEIECTNCDLGFDA